MTLSRAPRGEASPAAEDTSSRLPADSPPPVIVEATPLGVRAALLEMRARFGPSMPFDGSLGMAEIVLAEVLNNIVEHAYSGGRSGPIELRLVRAGIWLRVDVRDYGRPMPGESLPDAEKINADMAGAEFRPETAPEGGFGWFLIRAFARDLDYSRNGNQNRLRFTVPLNEDC
ncbi:serine/threonine-protein kinase RsbW [Rhodovulum sulfidophilum]|uniref:ATP-binding protein n=1 Tax=Rhodovulum sulfidophilum TaxID=35806 RepID=UPI0006988740|nr:ATP-binding protein [Rhodovulum sulfidophilum]ANB32936.1 hypothetical protein A6W98_01870 [Rhodovulum sulfidophilum DSM 1374]ANB36785.1 hypothetical protein A6024_01855 [Rhodovulum sulfidophilum]MCW2304633.1 serine/threonine-protein kinase RsbW [Rhodovulum sulfidophilum]